jgi:hypothetical protein
MSEQRKAAQARVRAQFLEVKDRYRYLDVREPEIGALIEVMTDQEVRIENMEAALASRAKEGDQ